MWINCPLFFSQLDQLHACLDVFKSMPLWIMEWRPLYRRLGPCGRRVWSLVCVCGRCLRLTTGHCLHVYLTRSTTAAAGTLWWPLLLPLLLETVNAPGTRLSPSLYLCRHCFGIFASAVLYSFCCKIALVHVHVQGGPKK